MGVLERLFSYYCCLKIYLFGLKVYNYKKNGVVVPTKRVYVPYYTVYTVIIHFQVHLIRERRPLRKKKKKQDSYCKNIYIQRTS